MCNTTNTFNFTVNTHSNFVLNFCFTYKKLFTAQCQVRVGIGKRNVNRHTLMNGGNIMARIRPQAKTIAWVYESLRFENELNKICTLQ